MYTKCPNVEVMDAKKNHFYGKASLTEFMTYRTSLLAKVHEKTLALET